MLKNTKIYGLSHNCSEELMKFQSRDFPVMKWLDTVAAKRDAGYWNDCEFSPMSCLLRRKRKSAYANV
ncbi:unnamed protein product [Angiostrongylus costaricensis]|uniref:Phospholipase B-like n=1 Tax=Angiostrongylus costaricensis TaxID=334426 RepID=A0A0R3PKB0_ANGCS|nr:unnamed protein product [Angiostrongylus costaricensis]